MKELDSALVHELHTLSAAGAARVSSLAAGLQGKMEDMLQLKDMFEQQLQSMWQEYAEMHGQMAAVQQVGGGNLVHVDWSLVKVELFCTM